MTVRPSARSRLSASAGSVSCRGPYLRVVGLLVPQRGDLGRIGNLELEKPAVAQRIGGDKRRIGNDRLVDLDDLARHRRVHLGGRLDRLNHCGRRAFGEAFAGWRQLDKDQITELLLSMWRD